MGNHNSLEFYIELLCSLRNDIALSTDHINEAKHDIAVMRRRAHLEGESFFTKTLPRLGKAVDTALSTSTALTAVGWKTNGGVPRFLGVLLRRVFNQEGIELSNSCSYSVRSVRQILYFMYKSDHPHKPSVNEGVVAKFEATDKLLVDLPYLGTDPVVRRARVLIARLFDTTEFTNGVDNQFWRDIKPAHGPGAVATGERDDEKYYSKESYSELDKMYSFEYFCSGLSHLIADQSAWVIKNHPTAKVVLVPKDSRGPRIISCEPCNIQWIQQGIRNKLYWLVERHPLTRGYVNFTNQGINRELATRSSVDGKLVTLDMSDASDRVSLQLVKELFSGTQLLEALLASRSSHTRLPDGREIELNKFAPMGSALCFPVEALVFWSLAVSAIQLTRGYGLSRIPRVYVYGDDMICDKKDYLVVMQQLERFHLKWNQSKCCTAGFFRESCGQDAHRGISVTPLRFRRRITSSKDASQYKSLLSLTNRLELQGYLASAAILRDCVLDVFGHVPATGSLEPEALERFLYISDPRAVKNHNRWTRSRFFRPYQVFQRLTLVPLAGRRKRPSDGWECGLRSLASEKPAQSDHGPDARSMRLVWKYATWHC